MSLKIHPTKFQNPLDTFVRFTDYETMKKYLRYRQIDLQDVFAQNFIGLWFRSNQIFTRKNYTNWKKTFIKTFKKNVHKQKTLTVTNNKTNGEWKNVQLDCHNDVYNRNRLYEYDFNATVIDTILICNFLFVYQFVVVFHTTSTKHHFPTEVILNEQKQILSTNIINENKHWTINKHNAKLFNWNLVNNLKNNKEKKMETNLYDRLMV